MAGMKFYGHDGQAPPPSTENDDNPDRGPAYAGPVLTMKSLMKPKPPADGEPAGERLWRLVGEDGTAQLAKGAHDYVTDEERATLLTDCQLREAREAMRA